METIRKAAKLNTSAALWTAVSVLLAGLANVFSMLDQGH